MSFLENLFKYKEPLYLYHREQIVEGNRYNKVSYNYGRKVIKDGTKVGINNPVDLYNKLLPFFRYLISKMKDEVNNCPNRVTFNISVHCPSENSRDFIKVIHFELNHNFQYDILLHQNLYGYNKNFFKSLFHILVKVSFYYGNYLRITNDIYFFTTYEDGSEDESEDEREYISEDEVEQKPYPIRDPFKTDQCVICLEKEPCILFVSCLHKCVCLSCETAKPSLNCPCCRSEIYQRIKL